MGTIIYISAMIIFFAVGFIVTMRTMARFNKKHYSKNN